MAFLGPAIWDELSGAHNERNRAQRDAQYNAERAAASWAGLSSFIPHDGDNPVQLEYGKDVVGYGDTPETARVDPALLGMADRGPSEFQGMSSKFDALGPSAYEGASSAWGDATSAYGDLGPSAYGDLALDPEAVAQMKKAGGYFEDLTTNGTDPIAEADLARKVGEAEQRRKANTDAALASAETRGMADQGVLAALENAQGSATDQYQAGLDANAMAAGRRDQAARAVGDLGTSTAGLQLRADESRAGGVDAYGLNRAAGTDAFTGNRAAGTDAFTGNRASALDAYGVNTAGGSDAFAVNRGQAIDQRKDQKADDWYRVQEINTQNENAARSDAAQRARSVADRNVNLQNDTTYFNKVESPQQRFNNLATVTAGQTGQYNLQQAGANATKSALDQQTKDRGAAIDQTAQNIFTWGAASGGKKKEDEDKPEWQT